MAIHKDDKLFVDSINIYRLRHGPDKVVLKIRERMEPFGNDSGLEVEFSAPRGLGEAYCAQYFKGVPVDVFDLEAFQRAQGQVQTRRWSAGVERPGEENLRPEGDDGRGNPGGDPQPPTGSSAR